MTGENTEYGGVQPDKRLRGYDRKRADQLPSGHTAGFPPGQPRHDGHPGPAGAAGRDLPREHDSKRRA